MKQFLNACKIDLSAALAVSAGTAIDGAGVDMAGWDGVVFFGAMATANAGNFLKGQQSDDDGSSDAYSDLAGSKVVAAHNADIVALDIYKPAKRYVKPYVVRAGANTAMGDIYAIRYRGGRLQPADNAIDDTIVSVKLITPDEGTA